ncbi:MAG: ParB/RepB/Spo0J family partition protein [Lachnospiraceae bacterium]|nr:ParB/RepB/Spo0J family partition protein [Lachnospiraceae bacterium]
MIQEIELSKLRNHPQNVRKTYSGLEELADSIKAQGILQNLTVVVNPAETGTYLVVIGNRRLKAAQLAGLKTAPCSIVEMDEKEQFSTMLLENMQRNDLTIYEQAQGFQLMLDLGETEDTISEKTGFSKTTIRHRLNIAKLDQDLIQKKESSGSFQLSLKDLYELEKIENINTRNKILKEATSSRELIWKAQSAADNEKRDKNMKQLVKLLEKRGIKKAPKKAEDEQYSGKWITVKEYDLNNAVPKEIRLPKEENTKDLYYVRWFQYCKIIKARQKQKQQLTPAELELKQRNQNMKKIKAAMKEMGMQRREFISNILSGKISPIKDDRKIQKAIWNVLVDAGVYLSKSAMKRFFTGKAEYDCTPEEKDEAAKQVDSLSFIHSLLVMMNYAIENIGDIYDWQGFYKQDIGKTIQRAYEILEQYGWSFAADEDLQIINGTHEWYRKQEAKK